MHTHQWLLFFRFNKWFWGVFCLMIIANVFFYFFVIARQRGHIDTLQINYKNRRALSSTGRDSNFPALVRAKEDIHSFKAQLPERIQFTDIVMGLFKALQNQGLVIGKMSYKPETIESEGLMRYTTSFVVTGKYSRLKAFLAEIQNSKNLYCIEHRAFDNRSEQSEVVEMKLTVATYFR